jgi:hypothetical protein
MMAVIGLELVEVEVFGASSFDEYTTNYRGTGSYDALSSLAFGFCGEHLNIRLTRLANA